MALINRHTAYSAICHFAFRFIVASLVVFSAATQAQIWNKKQPQLLPEAEAFAVVASVNDQGLLQIDWSIAEGYYMYREQFSVSAQAAEVDIGALQFPQGVIEDDPEFGEVEVYFFNASLQAPLTAAASATQIEIVVKGQGCNKPVGVCYPPITRTLSVDLPAGGLSAARSAPPASSTTTATENAEKSFFAYLLSAFLAGVLLSFTPCVLPMIPILAGVIAGQDKPSKLRSGWLACCYVAGTIVTYIIAGALAGATGAQLQAYFQNIWVIGAICLLLVLLAASLFGWYRIELPSALQTRLHAGQGGGRSAPISSFVLGLISALVVGACVSPVLILALGAAITQGDPYLGAGIMGSMALGMGLLLILFGFGAGWILPRAGAWMNQVQILFGFMVLAVAVYLLSAFPSFPGLYFWAALLLVSGFYVWQLATQVTGPLLASLTRTLSAALLIWGAMALIGGSLGGGDVLRPLARVVSVTSAGSANGVDIPFQKVFTVDEVQQQLLLAKQQQQPILIDYYADWCLDCKRMDRTTFRSVAVQQALQDWRLVKIDVTETSAASEAVKRHFEVFGPPATLFINRSGQELEQLRQYGYINENNFLALLTEVEQITKATSETQ